MDRDIYREEHEKMRICRGTEIKSNILYRKELGMYIREEEHICTPFEDDDYGPIYVNANGGPAYDGSGLGCGSIVNYNYGGWALKYEVDLPFTVVELEIDKIHG